MATRGGAMQCFSVTASALTGSMLNSMQKPDIADDH